MKRAETKAHEIIRRLLKAEQELIVDPKAWSMDSASKAQYYTLYNLAVTLIAKGFDASRSDSEQFRA